MNKYRRFLFISTGVLLLLTSACGTPANNGNSESASSVPTETQTDIPNEGASPATIEKQLQIEIDQTQKPIDGNSFDFVVKQYPEGYSLAQLQWISDQNQITNSYHEAIEHGGNGEDGFYISGNGQFSGFFYPDDMKGEKGKIVITFANDDGEKVVWEETLVLK